MYNDDSTREFRGIHFNNSALSEDSRTQKAYIAKAVPKGKVNKLNAATMRASILDQDLNLNRPAPAINPGSEISSKNPLRANPRIVSILKGILGMEKSTACMVVCPQIPSPMKVSITMKAPKRTIT